MGLPALLLCLIFIAYMLVQDVKRRPSTSWAVWLPIAFLFIEGSRPPSMWLWGGQTWDGQGSANDVSASPIDQLFYFVLIVASYIICSRRHARWSKFFAANIPILVFYLYFAISICWAEDPMGSSKRLFKDFGMVFIASVMLTEKNPLEAIGAVYVRCAYILFSLSAVCIKWFPGIARQFAMDGGITYTGVTLQKNSLGEVVLVFTLFLVWDTLENLPARWRWTKLPWDRVLMVLIGVWLLHMCQSKTAFTCLLLSTGLVVRKGWFASRTFSRIVLAGALSIPYILFCAQQYSSVIAPIVEALGRNMTFTGRTDIWQHINSTTVNPLIGYGYYNFWGGAGGQKVNDAMNMTIPNAHDGYVDMYLDGGFIGLILLAYWLIAYGRRLMNGIERDRFQRLRFATLIAAIIYNVSESNWARLSPIWFTTVLIVFYYPGIKVVPRKVVDAQRPDRLKTQPSAVPAVPYTNPVNVHKSVSQLG
jgi:exopolysaccharide production protein ExoQ